ncbi:hypothetical protein TRFO_33685 [Tritrichomonas foetus]|uniref:RING-type domain-containing protein n=1 Tax=Tritrichomonas foetus TaxID=1144522 RepID=A0A1J4JMZ6_9EUKA|nr:hypothetical protein TRFO_33685 [Tritrichomonas foetus]|eukprot:OHS99807.1 hypothetical protein TRFO_33685 [Tritrichomonas foetus]
MGNSQSTLTSPDTRLSTPVRSNHSYFGQTTDIDPVNESQLEATIHELRMERYLKNSTQRSQPNDNNYPNFNSNDGQFDNTPQQEAPRPVQLKTVISFSNFAIRLVGHSYVFTFEMKSEAPGRLVLSSNGVINSLNFDICDKSVISLPLPFLADFTITANPNLEKARTKIDSGFQFVSSHILSFKASVFDDFQIEYTDMLLETVDDQKFEIKVNSPVSIITETLPQSLCMICLKKDADTAIAECGHKVICDDCLCGKAVRIHHCPICNKLTSF